MHRKLILIITILLLNKPHLYSQYFILGTSIDYGSTKYKADGADKINSDQLQIALKAGYQYQFFKINVCYKSNILSRPSYQYILTNTNNIYLHKKLSNNSIGINTRLIFGVDDFWNGDADEGLKIFIQGGVFVNFSYIQNKPTDYYNQFLPNNNNAIDLKKSFNSTYKNFEAMTGINYCTYPFSISMFVSKTFGNDVYIENSLYKINVNSQNIGLEIALMLD